MKDYEIGLIFADDEDYSNKAKWCNENNAFIEEIEPAKDGIRQFQIKAVPAPDIDKLKTARLNELSELVDKIFASSKTYLISSLGFRINSGSKALEDINGLIVLGDEVTDFNDFDNVIRKLSVEQLEVLRKEVIMAGQSIKKQKWAYRNQVENAKSVEILQKIEFEFAICDFKDKQQE